MGMTVTGITLACRCCCMGLLGEFFHYRVIFHRFQTCFEGSQVHLKVLKVLQIGFKINKGGHFVCRPTCLNVL